MVPMLRGKAKPKFDAPKSWLKFVQNSPAILRRALKLPRTIVPECFAHTMLDDGDQMNLDGKFALVTGAGQGIGKSTALLLAEEGADVAVVDINGEAVETTRTQIAESGRRTIAIQADMGELTDIERIVADTARDLGGIDILVNNAAITFPGDLAQERKRYDLTLEVNLRAPITATYFASEDMKKRGEGAVVNVSSAAALAAFPRLMSYGISKAGLERFTIDAAKQLAPSGIAVNTFRIDIPVASEGFVANEPDMDYSDWEPTDVPAAGILWMLRQPASYTGHNVGMYELRVTEGIMPSKAKKPFVPGDDHPAARFVPS